MTSYITEVHLTMVLYTYINIGGVNIHQLNCNEYSAVFTRLEGRHQISVIGENLSASAV